MWENLNESVSQFCSSKFWDTNLTWNSADPDFTVCFEKTFLVWIPCAFLWLFLPLEIYNLRTTKSFRIAFNLYNVFKLAIITVMTLIATTDVFYYTFFAPRYSHTKVDSYSSVIKFFTFGLVLVLTYKGPNRGIRTSGTLFLFSLLLALCGAPQFRSELRSVSIKDEDTDAGNYEFISYVIYYPLAVTLFFLNCFVDARPTATTYPMIKNVCPENHVSFLSQILFSWFDGFMWTGYKRSIREDDIWNLDYEMSPREIGRKFEPQWHAALDRSKNADSSVSRRRSALDRLKRMGKGEQVNYEKLKTETDEKRGASILGPLFRTFGFSFTFGVLMKLLQSVLQFGSPMILKLLIAFVSDKEELMWHGYLYSVILLLTTVLQVIFLMKHLHSMYIIGIQIRTALVTVIYKKALVISSGARKDFTIGQIVNLMAVDAQRFVDLMTYLPLLAVVPLEIFLSMYFLWDIIGPSVLAGLALLVLLMPLNAFIASRIQKLQIGQMKRKDERVKLIDEILSGIKVLKLYAWEPSFEREVTRIRDGEVGLLKSTAYLTATATFLFTCSPFMVTLVTFAAFVLSSEDHVLTPEIAFVSLSLFNILRFPMTVIPVVLSNLVQTYVAVKRIDKFLNSEELDTQAVSHEPSTEPVIIKDGQFSWDSEQGVPALCDINVEVKKGSLVAVVGSVGAGKSSLLSAILGEMYRQAGTINTYGTVAYVPQQAWIRNATLEDNITFGNTTENSFYRDVVEACALKPDFKMLPGGDQTEIGEKGVNLSGGQKQRISLARAVFSKADIHLLDDPLSAVDSHVGKHIFDQVIGPNGLLKDKTRILVTHSIAFLPQVDHIIVLVNGCISEAGTYDELIAKAGGFSSFLASHQTKENDEPDETKEEIKRSEEQAEEMRMSKVSLMDEDFQRSFFRSLSNPKVDLSEECAFVGQKLIEREKVETGNVKWNVCLYYLRASSSLLVILTILANVSYQLFSVFSNLWLSVWSSDTTIVVEGHQDMDKQYLYLGIYGVLGFSQAVSVVIQVVAMFVALLQAANYLHRRLLTSVLHWPVTTFDTIPSGRIINRFGFDVDVLDNVLPNNLVQLLNCTASVISTLFMICYSTPAFISVIIPLGAVYFCVQRFYAATSRQLKRLESATKSPVYSHFGETVSGAMSIRAYGLQSNFIEVSEEKIDHNQRCSHLYFVASRWLALRLELLGSIIVMFSSLFVVLGRNVISGSLVGLSLSYSLQITETLFYWAKVLTETETNVVAAERIKEYSEVEQEAPWRLPDDEEVPQNWPDKGAIAFDDFRVRYREGLGLVLKGVTFHVNGGEKVGIVGRTGAGKSSLSLCLFRLLESAGGRIIIDGIDVSSMGLHTLRSRLTIIPQDPVLFTGTLRMNLDPGQSYADESLWRALTLANLKTTVSNSSSGLNHEISEGGGNFSVGQRQLICLARALLRKTKILILDEATAAVDLETDDLIQNTIRTEFAECTVLTVAHRLNTILDYDKVIVLDQGRLVEYDSPEALLKSKQSIFYSMAANAGLV